MGSKGNMIWKQAALAGPTADGFAQGRTDEQQRRRLETRAGEWIERDRGTASLLDPDDQTARVWDATTGKPVPAPLEHRGFVRTAAISADRTRVVIASNDTTRGRGTTTEGTDMTDGAPRRHASQ